MRKIIMVVAGAITAGIAFFGQTLGIEIQAAGAVGALAIVLSYIFFEAKADIKRVNDGMIQFPFGFHVDFNRRGGMRLPF